MYEALAHGAHGFSRRVAVKRLSPEASVDPSLVQLFLDEARIASRMHHAGIVSMLDYGQDALGAFQVLELVEGWDASYLIKRSRARGERIPVDVALHLAVEVAHALAFAHELVDEQGSPLGIVHRDVKPSNMLVSRGGDVKLGDFGIALACLRASRTTGLVARGTPGFMSPEQLVGREVGPWSDVFSLGCTLQALIVGRSPVRDDATRALLVGGVALTLDPSLPEDVAEIVARAVHPDPRLRWESCRQLASAMGAALARRLRTDPKTRMLDWLRELMSPRAGAAPSTAPLAPVTTPPISGTSALNPFEVPEASGTMRFGGTRGGEGEAQEEGASERAEGASPRSRTYQRQEGAPCAGARPGVLSPMQGEIRCSK